MTPTARLSRRQLELAHWRALRNTLRREWLEFLATSCEPSSVHAETLSSERAPDHTRHLVRYESEPGIWVHAYLLVPTPEPKAAPGAVVFHATSSNHILQPAGLADAPTRHLGLDLVRRGYVVLCPRCFLFGYGEEELSTRPRGPADWEEVVARLAQRHPAGCPMGKMLADAMRAVDCLAARPEVDAQRLVCAGHSLGAKEVLYLMAFDERVRAGVASEGGVGLALSNWDAPWYLGQRMHEERFAHDHQDLLALIAPRALRIVGGGVADGPQSLPFLEKAWPVFDSYGKRSHLVLALHEAGHDFPDQVRREAFDWLDTFVREEPQCPSTQAKPDRRLQ